MARRVQEWIGKSDDSTPPQSVRLRVFNKYGGKCYLTGKKIMPGDAWDLDHVVALINGGQNRENNLAPALRSEHRKKTAKDVAEKAKVNRLRAKHFGMDKKSGFATNKSGKWKKKMDGKTVPR
jgi:5-methylcytosine-specific restriction enzyme A